MMEEEGAVIAGLLVGLNVIDANLCMKGEDLDSQVSLLSPSPLTPLRAAQTKSKTHLLEEVRQRKMNPTPWCGIVFSQPMWNKGVKFH